jgi:hypothetical protein
LVKEKMEKANNTSKKARSSRVCAKFGRIRKYLCSAVLFNTEVPCHRELGQVGLHGK